MRAIAVSVLAVLSASAPLAAQKPASDSVSIPGLSVSLDHPVERVYRTSLDAMLRVGYAPGILLLNEALVTREPQVLTHGIPTLAQVGFEGLGDSTRLYVQVVPVDLERRSRCETKECRDVALQHTLLIIGAIGAMLDSLPAEPRTAADSLREAGAYGYTAGNPIRVGGGVEDGVRKEHAYLASLRGPGGEAVSFLRIGSCCPFVPPGGSEKTARIDAYEVTYPGLEKPIVLYFDIYRPHGGGGVAPEGFTRAPDPRPAT